MKRFLGIILILLVCTNLGYSAKDSDKKTVSKHKDLGWWFSSAVLRELNLNDKQANDIKKLQSNGKRKLITMSAESSVKKLDLEDALAESKLNEAKIKKLITEVSKISADMTKETLLLRHGALKILTTQQRGKLRKLMLRKSYGLKKPVQKKPVPKKTEDKKKSDSKKSADKKKSDMKKDKK